MPADELDTTNDLLERVPVERLEEPLRTTYPGQASACAFLEQRGKGPQARCCVRCRAEPVALTTTRAVARRDRGSRIGNNERGR